jgi:hypothetical protein
MIGRKYFLAFSALLFLGSTPLIYGYGTKENEYCKNDSLDQIILPDTIKNYRYLILPDTIDKKFSDAKSDSSFTYKKYIDFLNKISDTSKYIVLPINEFIKTINPNKIIFGLRHDVDLDLNNACTFSKVENNVGFRSTYYILHTADYYLANSDDMAVHSKAILPTLKKMQNYFKHEIGWHNDLITLQLVYKIDPIDFLYQELAWLRKNGIIVNGTASHGSNYCYTYHYLNWYFWKEFPNPNLTTFYNYENATIGADTIIFKKASLKDFNLDYEAYFMNFNKYYSDSYINGQRWNFEMLDLNTLHPGDRIQILMHPNFYSSTGLKQDSLFSFNVIGQFKSNINYIDSTIVVVMPVDTKIDSLIANFTISRKANAYIGRRRLVSGVSTIDFSKPVNLKVVAENGLNSTDWRITLINQSSDGPGSIFGPAKVCQGQKSVTYTLPLIGNPNSYKWTLPMGTTGKSTTNSIKLDFGTSATSGYLSVTENNSLGDNAKSSLYISVNEKPMTPTVAQNDNILISDAVIGNQWFNKNGLINGAIDQHFTVKSDGYYYVIVTANGCSSEPSNSIDIAFTGDISRLIKTYPNPVMDELIIETEDWEQQTNFQILSSGGQIVFKGNLSGKTVVQTSDFFPGLYLIKLESGKAYGFKKIVKK